MAMGRASLGRATSSRGLRSGRYSRPTRRLSGGGPTMSTVPRIISVDDHVVEPPDLWTSRLPARFRERGPRLVRERGRPVMTAFAAWQPSDDGDWADIWYYDDLVSPVSR